MDLTCKFNDIKELLHYTEIVMPDIIVVEGYNGVGKSRVLESLQEYYNVGVYRPAYNGWTNALPKHYRWSIFASFVDVINSLHLTNFEGPPLLFDRGFFSAIYNDVDLIKYYKDIIKDLKVLQILVTCDEESYYKFLSVRDSKKTLSYEDCSKFTEEYRKAFSSVSATYVEFLNSYDESIGKIHASTCRGCGHYNIGDSCCKHPAQMNKEVSPHDPRCSLSKDKEVQDIGELYTVSP